MWWYPLLFWVFSIAAILWGGQHFIVVGVGGYYFPMAARGDLFHPLRVWALALPCLTVVAIFVTWLIRRPLSPRVYLVGIFMVAAGALIPFLPRVDSGYEQVFWIGDQKYSIPWRYAPRNGQAMPGGTFFLVRVAPETLVPAHAAEGETITIGKSADQKQWNGKGDMPETCFLSANGSQFKCAWKVKQAFFYATGDAEHLPPDPEVFVAKVAALLDGFAVKPR